MNNMSKAFGIVNFAGNHIQVDGLQAYRPVGAFSFLGRYRTIDFPISNMSNSGIDNIQVYVRRKPRSLTEHLGTGRHYNINSKRGQLNIMYTENNRIGDIYSTDVAAYIENMDCIERIHLPYVVIAPSYMIYTADYSTFLSEHIESGADISMMYHSVDNAKEAFLNCGTLNINKQKGVLSIEPNHGNAKNKNISLDTYVMSKELFIDLVKKAHKTSSMYTFADILNEECENLDIRAVSHRGYFAAICDSDLRFQQLLSRKHGPDRPEARFRSVQPGLADLHPYERLLPDTVFRGQQGDIFGRIQRLPDRGHSRGFHHRKRLRDQTGRCRKELRDLR